MNKKRPPTKDVPPAPITPAEINKANREFWEQEKPPKSPPAKAHFKTLKENRDRNKIELQKIPGAFEGIDSFINTAMGEAKRLHALFKDTEYLQWRKYIDSNPPNADVIAFLLLVLESDKGRQAANALHDKPGGSRDKQKAIRDLWASGKFKSRDVCAEQECAALDMSFAAARKALRNTPRPAPATASTG